MQPSPDQRLPMWGCGCPEPERQGFKKINQRLLAVPLPSHLCPSGGLDDLLSNGWSRLQGGRAGGLPRAASGESPPGHAEVPHSIPPSSREPGAFRSNSPHPLPALPQGQIARLRGARALLLICISAAEVGLTPRRGHFSLTSTS